MADMRDFFISYRGIDETGALWVTRNLSLFGYSVAMKKLDFPLTRNLPAADRRRTALENINRWLRQTHVLVACLSNSYFDSDYTATHEFAKVPRNRILILLFHPLEYESQIAGLHPVRMYDCWREERKERLLRAAIAKRGRPRQLPYERNPRELTEEQVRRLRRG
jgi:hypothetical protein